MFYLNSFRYTTVVASKTLSGYNHDVVANGSGSAADSTTIGCDGENSEVLYSETWPSASTGRGMPESESFTSLDSGRVGKLRPYGENNVFVFSTRTGYSSSITITLDSPQSFTSIPFFGFSGAGVSNLNYTVNFDDSTIQTGSNFTIKDWFNGTPYALICKGRVMRSNNSIETTTTNPRIYELELGIESGSQSKKVESVEFTATTLAVANIFGILEYHD